MAATTDTRQLQLQVAASAELLVRNLRQADNAVATFQRGIDTKLDAVDRRFGTLGRSVERLGGSIKSFAPALSIAGIGLASKQYLELADAAKTMQAQLRLATAEFGTFGQAQVDVERIAATTRIGLAATTSLYGNFLRASQPLGRSQADAAAATESFAKALKIGGAGAEQASQATLQFSQALASGVLRGDEFNSIAEASPRLLKLFADGIGQPQGKLRALAAEGKLTADVLLNALTNTKITAGLDAEFKQLPVTMGDAMTLVRDAAIKTAGAFDRGSELSGAIASLVTDSADGFGSMAKAGEAAGQDLRATFLGLRDLFQPMQDSAGDAFGEIEGGIGTLRDAVAGLLDLLDVIPNQAVRFTNAVNQQQNDVKQFIRGNTPSAIGNLIAPDAPMIGEYNNGAIFRQNAGRARLYQNARAADRNLSEKFGGISRREDGSLNLGVRSSGLARPVARTAAAEGSKASRPKGRSGSKTKPIKFGLSDIEGVSDPVALADALKRYQDQQSRAAEVILGKDAIGDIISGYDAELRAKIDGRTAAAEKSAPKGELSDYRDELERVTGDMTAALQGVAVNGLMALEDGFADVLTGTRSVGDAFKDMTRSIVADLARIAVQKAVLKGLQTVLPGSAGFFGFADGGPIRRATGGPISGPGGPRSDVIPALLSNGEYVVNAAATARHRPLIEAINRNRLPRFADGGAIGGARAMRLPSMATQTASRAGGPIIVRVSLTDDLDARIDNRAVGVAVEVVKASAPSLTQMAVTTTVATLREPTL